MNGPADGEVDYKKKYRNLKRKLKFLIYEHECFQEELRKAQRKLLKVSRDKSFLLDRLLQYENVDEDSSDSDATASSDNSETEGTPKLSDTPAPKSPLPCPFSRKRSPPLGGVPSPSSLSLPPSTGFPLQASGAPSPYLSSLPEPSPLRPKREKRPRLPRKLKMAVGPPDCPVGGPLTFPGRGSGAGVGAALAPLPPPKMPPPTILSAVPRQMFSDAGSGDDALDGDDDLVIDIPE
ncbi:INO80 complex subunit E isoform X4 [Panthera pardus]|uniref:INO80 complex subunit E isoform X4 n=1 Tax=Panthera pardus TaxID=9691 RepID=A0A9V1EYN6_PANPR|nr:INO80 complex subunit E isoform X4 [Panthera pardus]XP_019676280.1 INO80 complex subunit E isoform X8 [Felis catus]XP_030156036.1 INO80 complex subunit E isoform X5 [Lynx canadensis]XP_042777634.1 INO80 complex subunit E isoform X7 [Panthera leo]XP_042827390.1 INO80 complex subunit E isoform X7 [Panthera tigris]XP_046943273.1 INO80 complex subunit E isoform X6 [Lynx rufus]XP_058566585.1 INO80 complex subunit E isoform X8 [Neofelis nebulosa]XP_060504903.1 INO80 complex subunit E isoform X7